MTQGNQKEVTNEELARMIAEGFAGVDEKLDKTATKEDLKGVKEDLKAVDGRLSGVEERLTIVERKLDKALYREFERVDKLEKRMIVVEQKLGISQ